MIIIVAVTAFMMMSSPPLVPTTGLPNTTDSFVLLGNSVTPTLSGHEAESFEIAEYGIYQSTEGVNITAFYVDAVSRSDAAWILSLVASFAASNNGTLLSTSEGDWNTTKIELMDQYVQICWKNDTILILFGMSSITVDQLYAELIDWI